MAISSSDICAAADGLCGFVGFNRKTGKYIVRFSEDSFGMDVVEDSIRPACEFVWTLGTGTLMTLSRECLEILVAQNINDRLNFGDALLTYLRRTDLPEIVAERRLK
ncbi:DUF2025 family protein [Pseudomonas sp. MT3]|uniref:DUF2025 family protein n=1 Tax=Pseudomonas sp. ATCC 13867 TaxID=1294143 RepID=UPI0002C4EC8E|nr:DUF2025 family protein [Pseudomonas sp. ATCC 13867]AGI24102.1 hypothetical protein H681_11160 [Pseudomonas sp. ATCC 13867]RFQ40979.1 DUF2025 family protein [Pseudomonas sp. ATCC 13867]